MNTFSPIHSYPDVPLSIKHHITWFIKYSDINPPWRSNHSMKELDYLKLNKYRLSHLFLQPVLYAAWACVIFHTTHQYTKHICCEKVNVSFEAWLCKHLLQAFNSMIYAASQLNKSSDTMPCTPWCVYEYISRLFIWALHEHANAVIKHLHAWVNHTNIKTRPRLVFGGIPMLAGKSKLWEAA